METIIIDRAELSSKLQIMSKVAGTNNAIPILDNFLFEVTNNTMRITASDMESTITTSVVILEIISVEIETYINFAIDAKTVIGIFKTLNNEKITMIIDAENNIVTIDYDTGRYEIPMQDPGKYPKPKQLSALKTKFNVDPDILRRGISRTVFATKDDNNFPALSGVKIAINEELLSFGATDKYKIASIDNFISNTSASGSFILRTKSAVIVKDIFSKAKGVVDIMFDDTAVVFESRDYTIHCRTINAKFPDYKGAINRNKGTTTLMVNRSSLTSAVERVALCVSKTSYLVRIDILNNIMSVSAQDFDFKKSAKEKLPCSYDGENISFGLVLNNLLEILKNINSDEVVFIINAPDRGFIITPDFNYDNETLIMMTMPLVLS